ncbi:MAG TPA: aminotransferase class V-fold PLP-dependent enzyme [Actinomycetota bacterium]|nr:aminotransferase class V-fold PLP-dependent enzyme [Actinomycetota bacterium]
MHRFTEETARLAEAVFGTALERLRADPPPLGRPAAAAELSGRAGPTVTPGGLGVEGALRVFREVVAPATIPTDHPGFLAFVPSAPTKAAALSDLLLGVSSMVGAGWIDGAGAIWAENEALRWLADLAGLGPAAGGCFVSGGTAGNLSGLVAARHTALERRGGPPPRWALVTSTEAHPSIAAAARVMDVDVVAAPAEDGRLTAARAREALDRAGDAAFAVAATAGTTNAGAIDDLAGIAEVCEERGVWLHVDAAYGGAALCAPSARERFAGIERADSLIVDPHKWLFAPYDCCALLYRDPSAARRAFAQEAAYLEDANAAPGWNPMHLAFHMSRRARGLPLWFSLAVHGTDAYREAVEAVLRLAREAALEVRRRPALELVREPELSVLLVRRRGWGPAALQAWCDRTLAEGRAFVLPTTWEGERVLRLCFVNPRTTIDLVRDLLDDLALA